MLESNAAVQRYKSNATGSLGTSFASEVPTSACAVGDTRKSRLQPNLEWLADGWRDEVGK